MAKIMRVKARWSGFQGGPGYSIFHFRDFNTDDPTNQNATDAIARVRAFFTTINPVLPNTVSIQVEADVEVLEDTTGALVGMVNGTSVSAVTGTAGGTAPYAAAVGAVVTWRTSSIRNGRRMRGRTFLVPLSSTAFAADGTLIDSALNYINQAATALRSNAAQPDLGVYGRPSGPAATDGVWYAVTAHSTPDMGAVMRSRRD